jgi:hypothetical protein
LTLRGRLSVTALAIAFLLGLAIRVLIDWSNHHGPSGDGWSLQGNGALIFLPLVLIVLVGSVTAAALRRRWIEVAALPFALAAGMVAGGVFGV